MGKFTLTIKLGNDAMRTWRDIADALARVARTAERLDGGGGEEPGEESGRVMDLNGNRVGEWEVTP